MAVVAKWLTHRIVAPARVGSIPTYRPSKKARAIARAFYLIKFSNHAFSQAFKEAGPKILEPIYDVEVFVPADKLGDVMSDLQGRRGLIVGMSSENGYEKLQAKVPQSEMASYSTSLSSLTGGRASFIMKFASYELVPADLQNELIAEHEKEMAEEK